MSRGERAPHQAALATRWKVVLALLAALVAVLGVNAVVVSNETKAAGTTLDGARIIPTPHGDLQVTDDGPRTGSPIVLIHCYTCSLRWWNGMLPALEREHRVVRVDLLGHGGSEKPAGGYSIPEQADAVAAVLAQLGVEGATVVGHSLGGGVATALASEAPRHVSRLVVIDTGPSEGHGSLGWRAKLARVPILGQALRRITPDAAIHDATEVAFAPDFDYPDGFADPDQPVRDVRAMTYTSYIETGSAFEDYLAERPLPERIASAGVPLLVLLGADEQIIDDVDRAAAEYRRVPGGRVVIVPGAGHSPNVERPVPTAALVRDFTG